MVGDVVPTSRIARSHGGAHERSVDKFDAFYIKVRGCSKRVRDNGNSARMPIPVFMISMTASLALRMLGNRAVATVVGITGARRIVTSVTMPNVPSAPMNTLVVSNPADDLRDRRLVFITSPEGRTTVYREKINITAKSLEEE